MQYRSLQRKLVSGVKACSGLGDDPGRVVRSERLLSFSQSLHQPGEGDVLDQLHDDERKAVVLAELVGRHNVGVVKHGRHCGLAKEGSDGVIVGCVPVET